MAKGWAVTIGAEIDLRTVSPTERAAMVNGLVTIFGVTVYNSHTDEEIEKMFDYECGVSTKTVSLIEIDVTQV